MARNAARAADLPGFAWSLGRVLLVEADEQVDQLAAHRPGTAQPVMAQLVAGHGRDARSWSAMRRPIVWAGLCRHPRWRAVACPPLPAAFSLAMLARAFPTAQARQR